MSRLRTHTSASLVERQRVWLVAAYGLPGVREVGPEPALCGSAMAQDGVYVVNNAATDPRPHEHALVPGDLGLRRTPGFIRQG